MSPGTDTYAPGLAVRALELLARHLGMFDSENGSSNGGLHINIDLGDPKADEDEPHSRGVNNGNGEPRT